MKILHLKWQGTETEKARLYRTPGHTSWRELALEQAADTRVWLISLHAGQHSCLYRDHGDSLLPPIEAFSLVRDRFTNPAKKTRKKKTQFHMSTE